MAYPISAAQVIHRRDNPVLNPDGAIEEQLVLLTEQNRLLSEAVQQLIAGTPSTEVHYGTTPPDNPTEGDMWYHSGEARLYAYDEDVVE